MTTPAAPPEVTTAAMSRRAARLAAVEAAASASAEGTDITVVTGSVDIVGTPAVSVAASVVTAPRPHAQKGGRRAAPSFSDSIEKPAGGRRARISTPTTAEAVEPAVEAAPESEAGSATADIALGAPVAAAVVPVADATAVLAPRAVSRRSLRTTSLTPASTPSSTSTSGTDVAPASGGTHGAAKDSTPGSGAGGSSSAPKAGGRRSRRGDIAKGTFSVVAMLFAAGIAVATTMPASAFHAASAGAPETVLADVAPLAAQELTTGTGSSGASILRDDYSVRDVAALKAAGLRVADTFTNNVTSAVQWPFPVGVPISDGFGPRESPGGIGSTDHKGVDFTPGQGSDIHVVADGVVSKVVRSDGGGLGVYVIVDHVVDGEEVSSVYGHMLTGSIEVETGQVLKVGEVIGRVGNTGTSTGAHLHLEIRLNGTTAVDPYAWLSERVA